MKKTSEQPASASFPMVGGSDISPKPILTGGHHDPTAGFSLAVPSARIPSSRWDNPEHTGFREGESSDAKAMIAAKRTSDLNSAVR